MGIIWRNTMTLLSILAALVIIVHTENLGTDYNRGLRPRALDSETSRQEQSWRAQEVDSIQQSTKAWDNNAPEEPRKRLRPARKRRRRPQILPGEVSILPHSDETSGQLIEFDLNNFPTTAVPKRKRKNPVIESNRWMDVPFAADRPMRRHGQRKKRPSLDTWPQLSEFGRFHPDNSARKEVNIQTGSEQRERIFDDRPIQHFVREGYDDDDDLIELITETTTTDTIPSDGDTQIEDGGEYSPYSVSSTDENKNDKSLSEFSIELAYPIAPKEPKESIQKREKSNEKILTPSETFKAQGEMAIDAQTLKEILKRSNGTSLSEILQQNNLSLADLLNGRENAVSVLNAKTSFENDYKIGSNIDDTEISGSEKDINEEKNNPELKCKTEIDADYNNTNVVMLDQQMENDSESAGSTVVPLLVDSVHHIESSPPRNNVKNEHRRIVAKRKFPGIVHRKQRIRPPMNGTLKVHINKQILPLNARDLYPSRRNTSKLREWEEIIPIMTNISNNETEETNDTNVVPFLISPDEILLPGDGDKNISATPSNINNSVTTVDDRNLDVTEVPFSTTVKETEDRIPFIQETESSTIIPAKNASTLRRQAFNNRLKKKRLKQKNSTTESPQDDVMKNLFGMGDLVSSSEFIARTQTPKSPDEDKHIEITLEDFMTTERSSKVENRLKSTRISGRSSTTPVTAEIQVTTQETTKFEIEEILNDTKASAKLSRILMERNMTLSELVEHRERGSSHVHLADIFHNTSKEPNPSEPFLSKSFIEPISKETYPLRAILEANLHDPTAKATKSDSNVVEGVYVNIPVVMDFGNNVNENAENMGIMTLFHNFTNKEIKGSNRTLNKDSDGSIYKISITNVNDNQTNKANDTVRESRVLHNHDDDIVDWKELFSIMRKNHNNNTEKAQDLHSKYTEKITLEEDSEGDGLIVLADLQNLKDLDGNIGLFSDEKLEVSSQDKIETQEHLPGNAEKLPNNTMSVSVATASVAGLAMILFLLTYAAFKWKQQRVGVNDKKRSFCDDRIPTPVFESRKGHKNNCSNRSISPMLSTSNIYTLNTLDSHNGKESPDYMWDSLRTPFQ